MPFRTLIKANELSGWKCKALKKSKALPEYYVSVESWNFDQHSNCVLYTIEVGVLLKIEQGEYVMIFTFEKRYSQLRSVHKSLRRTFNDPPNLPKFPPKKIIGNLEREFVNERYQQLHDYFSTIPLLFKIEQNQEFKQCFNYQMLYAMWRSGVEASIHNTSLPFQGL